MTEPLKKVLQKSESFQMRPKFQKTIKILAEPFEGSEFYPMAEPSLPEPFFKFRRAKKGSVGKIQNPDGSGLNPIVLVQNHQGSVQNH